MLAIRTPARCLFLAACALVPLLAVGAFADGAVVGEWRFAGEGVQVTLVLGRDGRFTRTMRSEEGLDEESGTWSLRGGTLEIRLDDGEVLRMACRLLDADALEITMGEGQVVRMARAAAAPRTPGPGATPPRPALEGLAPALDRLAPSPSGHILYTRSERMGEIPGMQGLPMIAPKIWVMRGDGGGKAPFLAPPGYDEAGRPSWSADGSKVVFASTWRNLESANHVDVFLADLRTGRVERITGHWRSVGPVKGYGTIAGIVGVSGTPGAGLEEGRDGVPPVPPAGTVISYLGCGGRGFPLHQIGTRVPVYDEKGRAFDAGAFAFEIPNVPAGSIWVKAQVSTSLGDVAFVDVPPGGVGRVRLMLRNGATVIDEPNLTPDGRFVVATAWRNTISAQRIAENPDTGLRLEAFLPTSVQSLKVFEVATGHLVGGWDPSVMTLGLCKNGSLSRDGRRVAFDAGMAFTETVAWCSFESLLRSRPEPVVVAQGGSRMDYEAAIVMRYGHLAPSWSPDGTRLVFLQSIADVNGNVTGDLFVANADGSGARQLTRFPVHQIPHRPTWSPDGRRIAFDVSTSRSGGPINPTAGTNANLEIYTTDVYSISADGTDLRRLTDDGISADPAWGP